MKEYDSLYPDYPSLKTDFELLAKEDENPNSLIVTILKIVNAIRGG